MFCSMIGAGPYRGNRAGCEETTMKRMAFVFAALLLAEPALGFDTKRLGQVGSTDMEDLAPLVATTPKLKAEVEQAFAEVKKTEIQVKCAGQRFPGAWKELNGVRVAPYLCEFASDKWLLIHADVRVIDKRGRAYEKPTKQAMKNAVDITETKLRWEWSAKPPQGFSWFTGRR
jgi:hypothetical protein